MSQETPANDKDPQGPADIPTATASETNLKEGSEYYSYLLDDFDLNLIDPELRSLDASRTENRTASTSTSPEIPSVSNHIYSSSSTPIPAPPHAPAPAHALVFIPTPSLPPVSNAAPPPPPVPHINTHLPAGGLTGAFSSHTQPFSPGFAHNTEFPSSHGRWVYIPTGPGGHMVPHTHKSYTQPTPHRPQQAALPPVYWNSSFDGNMPANGGPPPPLPRQSMHPRAQALHHETYPMGPPQYGAMAPYPPAQAPASQPAEASSHRCPYSQEEIASREINPPPAFVDHGNELPPHMVGQPRRSGRTRRTPQGQPVAPDTSRHTRSYSTEPGAIPAAGVDPAPPAAGCIPTRSRQPSHSQPVAGPSSNRAEVQFIPYVPPQQPAAPPSDPTGAPRLIIRIPARRARRPQGTQDQAAPGDATGSTDPSAIADLTDTCWLDGCVWKGHKTECRKHLRREHPQYVKRNDSIRCPYHECKLKGKLIKGENFPKHYFSEFGGGFLCKNGCGTTLARDSEYERKRHQPTCVEKREEAARNERSQNMENMDEEHDEEPEEDGGYGAASSSSSSKRKSDDDEDDEEEGPSRKKSRR